MKFTMELNPLELRESIMSGTLLALAEVISKKENESKTAADIINGEKEEVVYQAPVQEPLPHQQEPIYQAPIQPSISAVPIAAPTYTSDQLAQAATQLMDAGRRAELIALLASFNIQALTALPKEQYGAFATQLRAMGAKI